MGLLTFEVAPRRVIPIAPFYKFVEKLGVYLKKVIDALPETEKNS